MNINEKDLLKLVALALSVGNGNERHILKSMLQASAIQVFKQSGFNEEQVKEELNKI